MSVEGMSLMVMRFLWVSLKRGQHKLSGRFFTDTSHKLKGLGYIKSNRRQMEDLNKKTKNRSLTKPINITTYDMYILERQTHLHYVLIISSIFVCH